MLKEFQDEAQGKHSYSSRLSSSEFMQNKENREKTLREVERTMQELELSRRSRRAVIASKLDSSYQPTSSRPLASRPINNPLASRLTSTSGLAKGVRASTPTLARPSWESERVAYEPSPKVLQQIDDIYKCVERQHLPAAPPVRTSGPSIQQYVNCSRPEEQLDKHAQQALKQRTPNMAFNPHRDALNASFADSRSVAQSHAVVAVQIDPDHCAPSPKCATSATIVQPQFVRTSFSRSRSSSAGRMIQPTQQSTPNIPERKFLKKGDGKKSTDGRVKARTHKKVMQNRAEHYSRTGLWNGGSPIRQERLLDSNNLHTAPSKPACHPLQEQEQDKDPHMQDTSEYLSAQLYSKEAQPTNESHSTRLRHNIKKKLSLSAAQQDYRNLQQSDQGSQEQEGAQQSVYQQVLAQNMIPSNNSRRAPAHATQRRQSALKTKIVAEETKLAIKSRPMSVSRAVRVHAAQGPCEKSVSRPRAASAVKVYRSQAPVSPLPSKQLTCSWRPMVPKLSGGPFGDSSSAPGASLWVPKLVGGPFKGSSIVAPASPDNYLSYSSSSDE